MTGSALYRAAVMPDPLEDRLRAHWDRTVIVQAGAGRHLLALATRRRRRRLTVAAATVVALAAAGGVAAAVVPHAAATQEVTVAVSPQRTDGAVCAAALNGVLASTGATSVAAASGGRVADVRAWLRDRPASGGLEPPNRGLSGLSNDDHVTVCVYRGEFPAPVPSGLPEPDGAEFIVTPTGSAALDAAGPIARVLASTPTRFPAPSQYLQPSTSHTPAAFLDSPARADGPG